LTHAFSYSKVFTQVLYIIHFFLVSEIFTTSFALYITFENLFQSVEIFRTFNNMRDIRDICDMLYGRTYFCILLIYSIYRTKYNRILSIK